jgi:hypothetical protein
MGEKEAILQAVKKHEMYGDKYLMRCSVQRFCEHLSNKDSLTIKNYSSEVTLTPPCYHNRTEPGNVIRSGESLSPCAAALKTRGSENRWIKSGKSKSDEYKNWVVTEK